MKILCINGGGVFGIIPAYFLSKVNISPFDVVCGTSIGSILSLGYASGKSTNSMYNLFQTELDSIFAQKNLFIFRGPEFKDKNLNKFLSTNLPGTLGSLNKKVIVPTFDANSYSPKIWNNLTNQDLSENTWEVARRSVAAPSYFTSWNGYIDGGLIANNPSDIAVELVTSKLSVKPEEIEIFSIGTGNRKSIDVKTMDKWYRWQWLEPMLKMLTGSNETMANFSMSLTPVKKYIHYNPVNLDPNWSFVDPSISKDCVKLASQFEKNFIFTYNNFLQS